MIRKFGGMGSPSNYCESDFGKCKLQARDASSALVSDRTRDIIQISPVVPTTSPCDIAPPPPLTLLAIIFSASPSPPPSPPATAHTYGSAAPPTAKPVSSISTPAHFPHARVASYVDILRQQLIRHLILLQHVVVHSRTRERRPRQKAKESASPHRVSRLGVATRA